MANLKLFNNLQAKPNSFKGVGISGKHATLGFNIAMSDEANDAMTMALINLPRKVNKKIAGEFIKGTKKLELRELKLKGKVAWDLELPVLAKYDDDHPEECTSPSNVQLIRTKKEKCTAFYECPGCHAPEPSNCNAVQYED